MSTETAQQSRGGAKRHTRLHRMGNTGARSAMGVTVAYPEARPDIPTHCGCGCGTEINQKAHEVLRLRAIGWTLRKIASEWDVPEGRVRMYTRQPTRFVLGHHIARGQWLDGNCHRCGAPVKVAPHQKKPPKCRKFDCDGIGAIAALERNCDEYDARVAARNAEVRARSDVYLERIGFTRPLPVPPKRDSRVVQRDNRSLHDLELEAAVNGATPELLALINEQQSDADRERAFFVSYMRSLDAPILEWDGKSATLYDKLDAGNNRHAVEWYDPTQEAALDNFSLWENCAELAREATGRADPGDAAKLIKLRAYRAVIRRDGDRCCYCGCQVSDLVGAHAPNRLTIDHVTARSHGGTTTVENLVVACFECNQDKADS